MWRCAAIASTCRIPNGVLLKLALASLSAFQAVASCPSVGSSGQGWDEGVALVQTFAEARAWRDGHRDTRLAFEQQSGRRSGQLQEERTWSRGGSVVVGTEETERDQERFVGNPGDLDITFTSPAELASDVGHRLEALRPAIVSSIMRTKTEAQAEAEAAVAVAESVADAVILEKEDIPVFVSRRRRHSRPRTLQVAGSAVKVKTKARPPSKKPNVTATADEAAAQASAAAASKQEQIAILGICVGIPCLSFLVVFLVTVSIYYRSRSYKMEAEPADASATSSDPCAIPRFAKPTIEPGVFQRYIFGSDMNQKFAKLADASLRASVVVGLCAICFWTPSLTWLTNQGWSMQHAVVVFCFTWSTKTGDVVMFSWYTYVGIFSGIISGLSMFAVFPDGVTELSPLVPVYFAVAHFTITSLLFCLLNWNVLCRLWALYLNAYFTMSFLNPQSSTHIARSFSEIAFKDGLVAPLIGTLVGCCMSLFTSLVPYPLLAFGEAQDLALEVAWALGHQWDQTVSHYTSGLSNSEGEMIAGTTGRLSGTISRLEACVQCSWWECFDLGRPGRVRTHLARLGPTYWYLHDWLHAATMAAQQDDMRSSDAATLRCLRPHLQRLSGCAWQVMQHAVRLAVSGELDPREAACLQAEVAELERAQEELAAAFLGIEGGACAEDRLPSGVLSDHALCLSIKSYSRGVAEYARYMLEVAGAPKLCGAEEDPGALPDAAVALLERSARGISVSEASGAGLQDWWDPKVLLRWDHVRNTLRMLMCFSLAFCIGRLGVPGVITGYSSTPAGCAVFIMNFDGTGGSAFVKKFSRFQGVAVGTLIGQLIFALLVSCSITGAFMGFVGVVMFQFFAFYFYFSSESFWYTGLLIATFGAMQVLTACDGFSDSPWQVYQALVDQVVAIVCCMVADLVLAPPAPSQLATDAYHEAGKLAHRALAQLLDPDTGVKVELHRDALFSKSKAAEARGAEAELEPRFVRTPWRHGLWQELLHHTFKLLRKLTIMEYVAAKTNFIDETGAKDEAEQRHGRSTVRTTIMRKMLSHALRPNPEARADSAPRKESVAVLLRRPLFQQAAEAFLSRRQLVFDMAHQVMMHETEAPLTLECKSNVQRLAQGQTAEKLVDAKAIVEEPEMLSMPSDTAGGWETANEVGTFLLMMELALRDLDAMAEAMMFVPEVSLDEITHAALHPPRKGLLREATSRVGDAAQCSVDTLAALLGTAAGLIAADLEGADPADGGRDEESPPATPRQRGPRADSSHRAAQ